MQRSASTARSASVLVLSHDGFLDRPSFVRVVAAVIERAQPQRGSTAVIALQLDGLGEVGAAFGGAQARRLVDDLHAAVKKALQLGAVGFDAVKHLVLCQVERRPPKLDLDVYPYLPRANVATTSVASYMSLLSGDAA